MLLIRSFLFNLIFYVSTAILAVCLLPCLMRGSWARGAGKFWGRYTAWLLYIVGLRHEIRGDAQKSRQVIYAVKHQSAWETIILYWELDAPVIVLKRELLRLPILGWFFLRSGCIPVDRNAGMAALKKMRHQAVMAAAGGRSLLIFPQGTRVASGQSAPYQIGVFVLYQATDLDVVPVALNSGRFWARNRFIKRPGIVIVHFLPALAGGLPRGSFMTKLEYEIETAMLSLEN
jgi:1-acyl-sn-glycerol-3-phosphate acyltransferase